MSGLSEVLLVLCTAPVEEGRALADRLLDEELIACANLLGPVESRYRWKGQVESAEEILLLMKTDASRRPSLRKRISELHSYDCPEVLEFSASGGLDAYLQWVRES